MVARCMSFNRPARAWGGSEVQYLSIGLLGRGVVARCNTFQ